VLLTVDAQANPNQAQALFLLDDAEPGGLDGFERCLILFDGAEAAAVAKARERWTALKAKGLPVSYWRQSQRGWEKQA
jgi:DNA polymerase III subunit chi